MHFKLYQDTSGQWRWTLYAANHRKIADSGEGYVDKADAQHGIALVKGAGATTPINE
jgi:uncharacterized protein YegP (UPF0339 family)